MPQIPQKTISQTELKHYNQSRSLITEALRWLQITTDTGIKLKVETTVKEIFQQFLAFITIDVLQVEQQHTSGQYIITLPMTLIIDSFFNKHPMSLELINILLIHPSDIVVKAMCRHQTLINVLSPNPNYPTKTLS